MMVVLVWLKVVVGAVKLLPTTREIDDVFSFLNFFFFNLFQKSGLLIFLSTITRYTTSC